MIGLANVLALRTVLRRSWDKNWPEVHAGLTGGLPQFILSRSPRDIGPNVPAFCYHVVDRAKLEADLDFLSRNRYVTIDADALLDHLEERRRAPERAVVLTIDDGARNLYHVAYPLLRRYRMQAVAFIAPRFHEDDPDDVPSATVPPRRPLSWAQIQEMHASGIIDFQSHTFEHRYVPRWPEASDPTGSDPEYTRSLRGPGLPLSEDFRLARETLEQRLNKAVRHLAFPQYKGTSEALRIGREVGYHAFWWGTLPHHPGNRPGHSPLLVSRVSGEFVRRLPGADRDPLTKVLRERYGGSLPRIGRYLRGGTE